MDMVKVGDIVDESFREELFDDGAAHAIDIHRVAAGEMDHRLDFAAGAFLVETIMETLDAGERLTAFGAVLAHMKGRLGTIAHRNDGSDDLGDDIRGFP